MTDIYNGSCPLCSGQLIENGNLLTCENDDYECVRSEFEEIWDDFDSQVVTRQGKEVTKQLLLELRNRNLKERHNGNRNNINNYH